MEKGLSSMARARIQERLRNAQLIDNALAEAAFALSYFQRNADLIPDAIPHIGILDDALIVSMVLRRHEQTFRRSSHVGLLRRPDREFEVDDLLSVIGLGIVIASLGLMLPLPIPFSNSIPAFGVRHWIGATPWGVA